MNVILKIDVKEHRIKSNTLFGLEKLPVKIYSLKESKSKDIVFQFNSKNEILYNIDQLNPIKHELMRLTKDMINLSIKQVDWSVQIVPMIKNAKQRIIVM
jgi:hypothetical protein